MFDYYQHIILHDKMDWWSTNTKIYYAPFSKNEEEEFSSLTWFKFWCPASQKKKKIDALDKKVFNF